MINSIMIDIHQFISKDLSVKEISGGDNVGKARGVSFGGVPFVV